MKWLCHKRPPHLNIKDISKISNDQLLRGLPKMRFVKYKVYATCEKGKQTKSSFKPKLFSSISDPFHILHMDLYGYVPVDSHFGKR